MRRKPKLEMLYEVAPAGELQEKYGLYAENRPELHLNATKVPQSLHPLIPLAEKYGVSDDIMRDDLIQKTPKAELRTLKKTVADYAGLLLEWLAGPESQSGDPPPEYVAFSALLMAADES